jgi:glycine cleavage system H lipoate-binding protein
MTCPFLKEAQVKFCQTATVRKLIPMALAGKTEEKCASADFAACPVYRMRPAEDTDSGPCPNLRESLMQYCGAAPVAKFIPYSESLLSRCGNDSFRYCELYLGLAHPQSGQAADPRDEDNLPLPGWLLYSANHMWLDVTDDGICHAGIDAFLSRALGPVERISYVWSKGRHYPTAILHAAGLDMEVVFPNPLLLTNCNLYLRADPGRLTAEPYTGGWLFEGMPLPETTRGLVKGENARGWMEQEQRRMNEFLQQSQGFGAPAAADGGLFSAGLASLLPRDRMLALFHEFFSPLASGKKEL